MPNPLATALAFLALALAGCQSKDAHMISDTSDTRGADAPAQHLHFKQNPQPKQAYRITIEIKNAPGPFESVEGFARYVAPECHYISNHLAGVPSIPEEMVPISYAKLSDSMYEAIVYLDAMLDEDYFGNGVCHWELAIADIRFSRTGSNDESKFIASIHGDIIRSEGTELSYLQRAFYPEDSQIKDLQVFGRTDRQNMASTLSDQDLFTISMISHKEAL